MTKRFPIQLTPNSNPGRTVTVYAQEVRPGQWSLTRRQVLRAQRELRLVTGDHLRCKVRNLTFSDLGKDGAQINVV
jgi:hypothetical protein